MKIALLFGKDKNSFYEGVNRPFLNWAKYLPRLGHSVYLGRFLINGLDHSGIREPTSDHSSVSWTFHGEDELYNKIREENVDVVVGDDRSYLPTLVRVKKKLGIKSLCYVQYLYGIHGIGRCFQTDSLPTQEKLVYSLSSLIPFKIMTHSYVSNLSKLDGVIANSKFTYDTLLLHSGIEALGVVYPPVDTEIFKPTKNSSERKEKQVLLYTGSHAADTSPRESMKIVEVLDKCQELEKVFALGSFPDISRNSNKIVLTKGVDDRKLAELYSMSYLTLCIQRWEMFGYVPAESMMCGTPVLSLTPHEGIIDGMTGWIAYNSDNLKVILRNLLDNEYDSSINIETYRHARQNFSAEESCSQLLNIIRRKDSQIAIKI